MKNNWKHVNYSKRAQKHAKLAVFLLINIIIIGDDFKKLKCGGIGKDEQTVWNENYSTNAARTAAGCVLELATKVSYSPTSYYSKLAINILDTHAPFTYSLPMLHDRLVSVANHGQSR